MQERREKKDKASFRCRNRPRNDFMQRVQRSGGILSSCGIPAPWYPRKIEFLSFDPVPIRHTSHDCTEIEIHVSTMYRHLHPRRVHRFHLKRLSLSSTRDTRNARNQKYSPNLERLLESFALGTTFFCAHGRIFFFFLFFFQVKVRRQSHVHDCLVEVQPTTTVN